MTTLQARAPILARAKLFPSGRAFFKRLLLFALILIAWELFSRTADMRSIPSVAEIFEAGVQAFTSSAYWSALGFTLSGWAAGLAIAALVGVPVGMLLGTYDISMRLSRGFVEFMRAVPSIMLVPLAVLLLGSTVQMKILLIALAALWPILLQSAYGIQGVDQVAKETIYTFRVPWSLRMTRLYLPSAAPLIATGLRIAATVGLLISIGAEIITSAAGLGYEISLAQVNGHSDKAFVFIITCGLVGIFINMLFAQIERIVLYWHESHRHDGVSA